MNYIKQLNAFWRRRQMDPLSSTSSLMYLAILHYANVSGWKKSFNLPNQMLMATCGVGRSELYRHRNQLISGGYIHYVNGRKGKAGTYTIIPFYDDNHAAISPANQTNRDKDEISPVYQTNNRTHIRTHDRTNNRTQVRNIHKLNVNENYDDFKSLCYSTRSAHEEVNQEMRAFLEAHCVKAYGRVDDGMLDIACELYLKYGLMKTIRAIEVSRSAGGHSIGYARAILNNEVVKSSALREED